MTENAPWLELLLVLTVGTAVMVGLAALADRRVRSAIWQRTIWQVTTLGVLALVLVELTGTGPALVGLWRARTEAEATQSGAAPLEPIPKPLTPGPSPRERGEGRRFLDPQLMADVQPSAAALEPSVVEDPEPFEEENRLPAEQSAETGGTAAAATDGSSQSGESVAGGDGHRRGRAPTERWSRSMVTLVGEPPEPRISGGSLTLDPGHPESGQPLGQASRWLGLIWALGAVLIAARTACARALLFAFWRRGTRLSDGPLCERAAGLARRLGIRRRVCVLEAVGLSAPVAFGSLRPAVALPVTFAEEFDRQQQDAVLAHELAHLAARDPAWQVVAGLLCAALWWHPLVWWSRHRLRAASEAAADEASLLVPDGPDLLAGCLVAMGRRLARVPSGRRQLGWVSFEGPGFRSSLGRRVERLLNLRARPWRAPGRGRLAFAKATLPVALMIVAVSCTAWARSQATLTEGGTTMSVLRVSWRHSLAAAMLLAFVSPASGDAVADDPPADQSLPVVAGSDLAEADGQVALLAEEEEGEGEKGKAREGQEREREEGEAREGEEREREEGEAREGEKRERKEGDAREGEKRERKEGEAREREGGERREAEVGRDRLAQELGKLEEKARDIRRRLEGLRDGQDAEARELQGALREVEGRMEAIRREVRAPEREGERRELGQGEKPELEARLRELNQRGRELRERAAAVQRELEGLKRDDQADQAQKLRATLDELRAAAERVGAEMRELQQQLGRPREGADRPRSDREQLVRRLAELKGLVGRLAGAGKREEAEAKEREVREIVRLLQERSDSPPPPQGPAEDLQRKIAHLKVAAENLRAAGLPEQAEQLVRQVDRLIEEHRRLIGRVLEPPRPPEPRERPVPPELAERLEQQGQAIRELHGAVNEMREQMAQMREMLQQLRRPEREEPR